MSTADEEARKIAIEYASGAVLPMVVKAAIELDLFQLIHNAGRISAAELAAQLPTTNPGAAATLEKILRLLTGHSILSCEGGDERRYALSPVGKFFIKNEEVGSCCAASLMTQDKVLMESWYHLKDAVLEGGIPFERAHGMSIFQYASKEPRLSKVINQAMAESVFMYKKLIEVYNNFEGIGTVVDVGGGTGALLSIIISNNPSIKGINFDLPHVVQQAPSYPGIEHVGGDMFVSVPKGDAIFMKNVLHNWDDEKCVKILKNCKESLSENGKVVIVESVLLENPKSGETAVELLNLLMWSYNAGGKERTEAEFRILGKQAGFQGFREVCCAAGSWFMEFYNSSAEFPI
ncbi:caffeic acid 3-O-methyltransferase-like [Salvia hispanica]|uniref:caffeic acid 3-O-methyltransferase-like n=1 Tax=Salvia hispanica TaxID=49212 RepID=UPI002008F1CE|nr:caffeic acid 3-O-methyltransferase-like [Salvia hispanica]